MGIAYMTESAAKKLELLVGMLEGVDDETFTADAYRIFCWSGLSEAARYEMNNRARRFGEVTASSIRGTRQEWLDFIQDTLANRTVRSLG